MQGQFVNSTAPGNFGSPGIYVYTASTQQVTPTGPALGKLGVIGTATYGPMNTPTLVTNNASLFAAFGPNTSTTNSAVRDACAAMPEANQVVISRCGDGTQTAATIVVTDGAGTPAPVVTLTAALAGSYPNGATTPQVIAPASAVLTLASGSLTSGGTGAAPMVRLTISFPNAATETYTVVAGTASAGLVMATLKANLVAAINTGSAKAPPSQRWTATSGSSTATALLSVGTSFLASGGTDGATTITSSTLIGTDGLTGRTGLYSLRNAINGGQLILAGYSMLTTADTTPQTLVAFNQSEGTRAGISFAQGTSTTTAITVKAANSATDPTLDVFIDWLTMTDPWTGVAVQVAPAAKGMGIISSLDFYQSPLNKPTPTAVANGAVGVIATEKYTAANGQAPFNQVSSGEYTTRYAAGINYLSKPSSGWALMSDKTSDGVTLVSDARAAWFFGVSLMAIVAPFLGQPQSNGNNDPTRQKVKAAINAFMTQQFSPVQKIGSLANGAPAYSLVCDTSNNTPTTVAQGFLNVNLSIQTLGNAAIILVQDQIGVTVNLTVAAN